MKDLLNQINTLENKVFRLECEQLKWREFRTLVETIDTMQSTFGTVSEKESAELRKTLESIKYL
jgi:hypothetical protein